MDGVLNLCKPTGPTSHDVVNRVRRIFGQKKVGHAGTLDPMATGVLVICLGKATRILEYLEAEPKGYRARMALGADTDTQDSMGNVICERDASGVTLEAFIKAAKAFVGDIEQTPPMVSAIKHQGKRLYELARKGETVERAPRKVSFFSIEVIGFTPGANAEAELDVSCSSGTYIRTLCADIGEKLGCGANMTALERTRVGRYRSEDSKSLEQLEEAGERGELNQAIIDIADALRHIPEALVNDLDVSRVLHGNTVAAKTSALDGDLVRIMGPDSALIAVGTACIENGETFIRPKKVLADPIG